jgi:pimeloyl-ACP methyl ester carboxylesterase
MGSQRSGVAPKMIKEIEFPSEGATLRGLMFLPEKETEKLPIVVMAHGTSATIYMTADKYAEKFRRAGLAVLLYDHRNFGSSGGEPRQEINPWIQCRGYRDAINFAATLPEVDPERIGLWGDSYSGGHVIVVGALDQRVKSVVAQCPVFGEKPPTTQPSPENFEIFKNIFESGDVSGSPETTTGPLPVVSFDQTGTPSLLKPIQAFRWFIDYGGRHGTGWINSVTRVIPDTPIPYHPGFCAPFIKAPTLLMVAPKDEMVHADYSVAREAFERLSGPKEWYDIAGGHFGLLYTPGALFDEASEIQAQFFKKWLSVI